MVYFDVDFRAGDPFLNSAGNMRHKTAEKRVARYRQGKLYGKDIHITVIEEAEK